MIFEVLICQKNAFPCFDFPLFASRPFSRLLMCTIYYAVRQHRISDYKKIKNNNYNIFVVVKIL